MNKAKKGQDYYEPQTGNCEVCGENYVVSSLDFDERFSYSIFYDCPECGYNPRFAGKIKELIDVHISASISSTGVVCFNSEELSDLVNEKIRAIWPKSISKNNEGGF
jgi:hypothetical protein